MQKIVPLSSYANSGKKQKRAYAFVKRSFDIVVSLVALLLLSPLFLVVSIIAAIDTKGKPLFIQQRMGKDNVPFMGSLYELTYQIRLKTPVARKAFLDELRCRNGNLTISCGRILSDREEL